MRRSRLPLRLEHLEDRRTPANVFWDGGGLDLNWNNGLNWSSNLVPGAADSVTISGAAGAVSLAGTGGTITALSLDNDLTVTGVGLTVSGGAFSMTPNRQLTVQSSGGVFSAAGATTIGAAHISALSSASVTLSGLTTLNGSSVGDTILEADGAGSILSLPNLTNVVSNSLATVRFVAATNGTISMPGVTSLETGYSQLYAADGGAIQAGSLTKLDYCELKFNTSGALPFGQFTSFKHNTIYAQGGTATFSALATLASASVIASNGAVVSMPLVTTIPASDAGDVNFQAYNLGSQLSFPNLTTIAASASTVHFAAFSGSQVSIPSVTSITAAPVEIRAEGTGSQIVATSLATLNGPAGATSYLTSNFGVVQVAAGLTSLDRVFVTLRNAADFPVSQLKSVTHGEIDVLAGGTITFTNLTTLAHSTVIAVSSVVSFPAVTSMVAPDRDVLFHAVNAAAKLDFPALTTIGGDANFATFLRASFGGVLSIPLVTSLTTGKIDLFSYSPSSVLDMPALTTISGPAATTSNVTVTNGGTLKTAAALSMDRLNWYFDDTASHIFSTLSLGAAAGAVGGGTWNMTVTNAGAIRPQANGGGAGQLKITGDYTQTSTGQLAIDLGGSATAQYDRLAVTGKATLGGTLAVATIGGHTPTVGLTYQPVTFGSRVGNFVDYTGLKVASVELQPSYGATTVTLSAITPNGPTVSSISPTTSATAVTFFDVTFSEPMAASSFTTSDVGITGPGGPYSASSISMTGPNTFRVFTTSLGSQGGYTITIGPNVNDAAGQPMNQDGDGTFGEASDDRFTGTITINLPNLNVSSITGVPASTNFGSTFNVSWTVVNAAGAGTANGTWTDRVWLSTDTVLDGGDLALGDTTATKTVAAGGNYTANRNVTLPTLPFRPDGTYFILVKANVFNELAESDFGNNILASSSMALANPPRVASVVINDGSAQRSRINLLTVNFTEAVTIPLPLTQAFTLTRTSGAGSPATVPLTATQPLGSQIQIGFQAGSENLFGSLIDGNFTLTVTASKVSDGVQTLDGNSDGTPGDNYSFNFFRKFGDGNGDGFVDQPDFIALRNSFGLPSFTFDYNNNGTVDQDDYIQFRNRFGT